MVKKGLKRVSAYIMVIACVMGFAACGSNEDNGEIVISEGIYEFEEKELKSDTDLLISDFYVKGNDFYYTYTTYTETAEEEVNKFCKYNIKTGENTELYDIRYDDSVVYLERAYYINDEEQKVFLSDKNDYGEDPGAMPVTTICYGTKDKEGNILSETDISEQIKASVGDSTEMYTVYSRFTDDGVLYASVAVDEKYVVCKIVEGIVESVVKLDTFLFNMIVDNEGNLIVSTPDESGQYKCCYVDFDKKALGAELKNVYGEYFFGNLIEGKGNIPFFIKNSQSLYIYDKEHEEKKEILKWIDSGLLGDNVEAILPFENEKLFCVYFDNDGTYKIGFLVKSKEQNAGKKTIKVASLLDNQDIQQNVIEYNKQSKDYRIEYITYNDKENPEAAFANDIIAGNTPDVLDVSYMDIDNFVAKGLLDDLTPYLEKDDVLSMDYFVDGILEKMAVDGKNYYLTKYFSLKTLVGKKSNLKEYADGWTVNEMIDYYKSKPEGTMLLDYNSKEYILRLFGLKDLSKYVDWNSGEVKFDSEEFRSMLEFCNSFPNEEYDDNINYYENIKEGKMLFGNLDLYDLSEIRVYNKLYDNDVAYVGYPETDKNGTYLYASEQAFAIASSSENKDGAWEFIKYIMTGEHEYHSGLPSSKAEFDKMLKRETTTVEYTEDDGTIVKPKNEYMEWNNINIKITPMSEEDISVVKELINKSKPLLYSTALSDMIEGEAQAYFDGTKSLDDTIKIIQDKLSKYINENR